MKGSNGHRSVALLLYRATRRTPAAYQWICVRGEDMHLQTVDDVFCVPSLWACVRVRAVSVNGPDSRMLREILFLPP